MGMPPQRGTLTIVHSPMAVTTRNLLVQNARNGNTAQGEPVEYCLLDPDDPARNTIQVQYTLEDWSWGDARDTTTVTVEIYSSDQTLMKTITVTHPAPGTYTEG